MGIEAGKIAVIIDDDPRLADVWKAPAGNVKKVTDSGSGGGDGVVNPGDPDRPQLSDIILKGFEKYKDDFGIERRKAKFRIYNSSTEKIDGFSFALTLSDQQGGRA
jgi:hypothetical protein